MIFGGLPNGRCGYYKYDANPPPNGIFASSQQLHDWAQFSSTASTGGKNNTENDNNKQSLWSSWQYLIKYAIQHTNVLVVVGYGNKAKKQRKIGKGLHVPYVPYFTLALLYNCYYITKLQHTGTMDVSIYLHILQIN